MGAAGCCFQSPSRQHFTEIEHSRQAPHGFAGRDGLANVGQPGVSDSLLQVGPVKPTRSCRAARLAIATRPGSRPCRVVVVEASSLCLSPTNPGVQQAAPGNSALILLFPRPLLSPVVLQVCIVCLPTADFLCSCFALVFFWFSSLQLLCQKTLEFPELHTNGDQPHCSCVSLCSVPSNHYITKTQFAFP
ncbi:hypothetical protein VTI74DRAFT_10474 [Chaetomium olivicolor]